MSLQDQVAETLAQRVAAVRVPPADVDRVLRRGRTLRRRRRLRRQGLAAALVAVVAGASMVWAGGGDGGAPAPTGPADLQPVGALDYSDGLRAVASPDGGVQLGGRSFPPGDMPDLDTAATATPYGMVFFDSGGHARLLTKEGTFDDLGGPGAARPSGYRPSSKADAHEPLVAFTLPAADGVRVVLHDLSSATPAAELDLDCGDCGGVEVEAVDQGLVFVRTGDGTYVWDSAAADDAALTLVGDGDFRLADARGGRLLWSGAAPTPDPAGPVADWPSTEGAIDATLSYDGGHVLDWSNELTPTIAGEEPIRLDVEAVFYAFDTDGSVLAATLGGTSSTVYDCEVTSGRCEEVGSVSTESGDPIFLGADM